MSCGLAVGRNIPDSGTIMVTIVTGLTFGGIPRYCSERNDGSVPPAAT